MTGAVRKIAAIGFLLLLGLCWGCGSGGKMDVVGTMTVDDTFDDTFCGEWEIKAYGVAWKIERSGNTVSISGSDVEHGEPFEFRGLAWNGSELSFTQRMPSTGHTIDYRLSVRRPDALRSVRTGDAPGEDEWTRRKPSETG